MDKIETQNSLTVLADQWQQMGVDFSPKTINIFLGILQKQNSKSIDDLKKVFPDLEDKIREELEMENFSEKFKFYDNILYHDMLIVKTSRRYYDYANNRRKNEKCYVVLKFVKMRKNYRLQYISDDTGIKQTMDDIQQEYEDCGHWENHIKHILPSISF